MTAAVEYYQPVFLWMHKVHSVKITKQYDRRLDFRRINFLNKLPSNQTMFGSDAWQLASDYLRLLEGEFSRKLARHSVYFWIHLYRRFGVHLGEPTGLQKDANTLGLVRRILELAISKFASLSRTDDMALSSNVKAKDVLGGHFQRIWKKHLKKQFEGFFQGFRALGQHVIVKFETRDFLDIYYLEALAYDYWRTTALMRAIGKGAGFEYIGRDWVENIATPELEFLINSYDDRITRIHPNQALAGTWFNLSKLSGNVGALPIAFYNIKQEHSDVLRSLGIEAGHDLIPNFQMGVLDFEGYWRVNSFMSVPFSEVYQCSFDSFIAALWGITLFAISPMSPLFEQASSGEKVGVETRGFRRLMLIIQRAYVPVHGDMAFLSTAIKEYLNGTDLPFSAVTEDEIYNAVTKLLLSEEMRKFIGLWSGGRRFPLVQHIDGLMLIDLQGLPAILESLFVGVQHRHLDRGTVFEESFKSAIKEHGYDLSVVGVVTDVSGAEREVDASVRIGTTLVLFECRSMERPLDFEIGRIQTFKKRQEEFDKKIDQAITLATFFEKNPKGRNYDCSWATRVISIVVSPFVEWIWQRDDRLWVDQNTPRILQADEAIRFLEKLQMNGKA